MSIVTLFLLLPIFSSGFYFSDYCSPSIWGKKLRMLQKLPTEQHSLHSINSPRGHNRRLNDLFVDTIYNRTMGPFFFFFFFFLRANKVNTLLRRWVWFLARGGFHNHSCPLNKTKLRFGPPIHTAFTRAQHYVKGNRTKSMIQLLTTND